MPARFHNLPDELVSRLNSTLETPIQSVKSISGGDISDARLITTATNSYFIKINNSPIALSLFQTEAKGLSLLGNACLVPKVWQVDSYASGAFLLMEYIQPGQKTTAFWETFGQQLATLHQEIGLDFGLDHPNFIGRLPQPNNKATNWHTFYITQRLEPQVKLATDNNLFSSNTITKFEQLYTKIENICPKEPSTLTHGDLWSGNFVANTNGQAVLIDPAVSYAHREMDLAMSLLFGGFDSRFYDSYNAHFALAPGFNQRVSIYQLYFLLVHVNLFGQSYVGSVENVLRKYA